MPSGQRSGIDGVGPSLPPQKSAQEILPRRDQLRRPELHDLPVPGRPVPQRRRVRAAEDVRLAAALQRPRPEADAYLAPHPHPGRPGRQRPEKRAEHRRPPDLAIERIAIVVGRREDGDGPRPGTARDRDVRRDRILVPGQQRQVEELDIDRRLGGHDAAIAQPASPGPAPRRRPPRSGRHSPTGGPPPRCDRCGRRGPHRRFAPR